MSVDVSYTERQRQCLSAMGLVAWRLRDGVSFGGRAAGADGAAGASVVARVPGDDVSGRQGGDAGPASEMTAVDASPTDVPLVEPSSAATVPAEPSPAEETPVEATPIAAAVSAKTASVGPLPVPATSIEAPSAESVPVPTSADSPVRAPTESAAALPASDRLPPDAEPLVAPILATPLPREPAALAAWLPDQPLAPFVWTERRLSRIGRDDAPLLVIVEREPAETLPLVGEAAELFERMLGAIGRTRRDTCQCVISDAPEPGGDTVATVAGTARPVTLVLVRELDGALDAAGCRLPGDPFGGAAWCLPHPEVLLAEPLAKRQAWLVLKAVRQHLPLLP